MCNKPIYYVCELSEENQKKFKRRASRMLSRLIKDGYTITNCFGEECTKEELISDMMNEKILTLYGTFTSSECIRMNDFFDVKTMTEKN